MFALCETAGHFHLKAWSEGTIREEQAGSEQHPAEGPGHQPGGAVVCRHTGQALVH